MEKLTKKEISMIKAALEDVATHFQRPTCFAIEDSDTCTDTFILVRKYKKFFEKENHHGIWFDGVDYEEIKNERLTALTLFLVANS